MSVTVSDTAGANYTWDSFGSVANPTWETLEAGKSWDGAHVSDYSLQGLLGFVVSDSIYRARNLGPLLLSETFVVYESQQKIRHRQDEYTWAAQGTQDSTWSDAEAGKTWEESQVDDWIFYEGRRVDFTDNDARHYLLNKGSAFAMSDGDKVLWDIAKRVSESIRFGEDYIDLISFILRISESITFTETPGKRSEKSLTDAFGVSDDVTRSSVKSIAEELVVSDHHAFKVLLMLAESLQVGEFTNRAFGKMLAEALELVEETPTKQMTKSITETLATQEFYGRVVEFHRVWGESLNVAEALAKATSLPFEEAIALSDVYRRNANGVVSDLTLWGSEMTEEDFDAIFRSGPAGYTPFREFRTGDYDYKDALIKTVMGAGSTSTRPRLNQLTHTVDVPDVQDRGQVTVPVGGITVNFNRSFYEPPEVNATLKGGLFAGAVPIVDPPTTTGFFIKLEDASGNTVEGVVSWTALGY